MIGQLFESWWVKPVALLLLVLTLCPPALAQEMAQPDVCVEAERDAETDTNRTIWFIAGCLGGVLGLLIAHMVQPSPPATKLLGKSPEYVAVYTDCYKRKAKSIQTKTALTGCAVYAGCVVVLVVAYVAIIAAVVSSEDDWD